jgi:transcriptional regulator with XRE-family HTH domain
MKEVHKQKYTKLGLKISYYRKLRGLTQEQLAEQLDKNLAFIGAVEAPNMARTISLDTLFDIAAILDVPPHRFIQFDDE